MTTKSTTAELAGAYLAAMEAERIAQHSLTLADQAHQARVGDSVNARIALEQALYLHGEDSLPLIARLLAEIARLRTEKGG